MKDAARSVDRSPSTLRDWIRAGELRAYKGPGHHESNRPTLVSAEELRLLVVKSGKLANPPRRLPVEEEELRARLARVEEELRASQRAEVESIRREVDALRLALTAAEERARDLVVALDRERARADGAEAEVAAMRSAAGLPWWRRLLTG